MRRSCDYAFSGGKQQEWGGTQSLSRAQDEINNLGREKQQLKLQLARYELQGKLNILRDSRRLDDSTCPVHSLTTTTKKKQHRLTSDNKASQSMQATTSPLVDVGMEKELRKLRADVNNLQDKISSEKRSSKQPQWQSQPQTHSTRKATNASSSSTMKKSRNTHDSSYDQSAPHLINSSSPSSSSSSSSGSQDNRVSRRKRRAQKPVKRSSNNREDAAAATTSQTGGGGYLREAITLIEEVSRSDIASAALCAQFGCKSHFLQLLEEHIEDKRSLQPIIDTLNRYLQTAVDHQRQEERQAAIEQMRHSNEILAYRSQQMNYYTGENLKRMISGGAAQSRSLMSLEGGEGGGAYSEGGFTGNHMSAVQNLLNKRDAHRVQAFERDISGLETQLCELRSKVNRSGAAATAKIARTIAAATPRLDTFSSSKTSNGFMGDDIANGFYGGGGRSGGGGTQSQLNQRQQNYSNYDHNFSQQSGVDYGSANGGSYMRTSDVPEDYAAEADNRRHGRYASTPEQQQQTQNGGTLNGQLPVEQSNNKPERIIVQASLSDPISSILSKIPLPASNSRSSSQPRRDDTQATGGPPPTFLQPSNLSPIGKSAERAAGEFQTQRAFADRRHQCSPSCLEYRNNGRTTAVADRHSQNNNPSSNRANPESTQNFGVNPLKNNIGGGGPIGDFHPSQRLPFPASTSSNLHGLQQLSPSSPPPQYQQPRNAIGEFFRRDSSQSQKYLLPDRTGSPDSRRQPQSQSSQAVRQSISPQQQRLYSNRGQQESSMSSPSTYKPTDSQSPFRSESRFYENEVNSHQQPSQCFHNPQHQQSSSSPFSESLATGGGNRCPSSPPPPQQNIFHSFQTPKLSASQSSACDNGGDSFGAIDQLQDYFHRPRGSSSFARAATQQPHFHSGNDRIVEEDSQDNSISKRGGHQFDSEIIGTMTTTTVTAAAAAPPNSVSLVVQRVSAQQPLSSLLNKGGVYFKDANIINSIDADLLADCGDYGEEIYLIRANRDYNDEPQATVLRIQGINQLSSAPPSDANLPQVGGDDNDKLTLTETSPPQKVKGTNSLLESRFSAGSIGGDIVKQSTIPIVADYMRVTESRVNYVKDVRKEYQRRSMTVTPGTLKSSRNLTPSSKSPAAAAPPKREWEAVLTKFVNGELLTKYPNGESTSKNATTFKVLDSHQNSICANSSIQLIRTNPLSKAVAIAAAPPSPIDSPARRIANKIMASQGDSGYTYPLRQSGGNHLTVAFSEYAAQSSSSKDQVNYSSSNNLHSVQAAATAIPVAVEVFEDKLQAELEIFTKEIEARKEVDAIRMENERRQHATIVSSSPSPNRERGEGEQESGQQKAPSTVVKATSKPMSIQGTLSSSSSVPKFTDNIQNKSYSDILPGIKSNEEIDEEDANVGGFIQQIDGEKKNRSVIDAQLRSSIEAKNNSINKLLFAAATTTQQQTSSLSLTPERKKEKKWGMLQQKFLSKELTGKATAHSRWNALQQKFMSKHQIHEQQVEQQAQLISSSTPSLRLPGSSKKASYVGIKMNKAAAVVSQNSQRSTTKTPKPMQNSSQTLEENSFSGMAAAITSTSSFKPSTDAVRRREADTLVVVIQPAVEEVKESPVIFFTPAVEASSSRKASAAAATANQELNASTTSLKKSAPPAAASVAIGSKSTAAIPKLLLKPSASKPSSAASSTTSLKQVGGGGFTPSRKVSADTSKNLTGNKSSNFVQPNK